MITVTHEKVVRETFGLIDLEARLNGFLVMLKVPSTMDPSKVEHVKKRVNKILSRLTDEDYTC